MTDTEYVNLLAAHMDKIGVLRRDDGSRVYSGRIGVWRDDVRQAVDDLLEPGSTQGVVDPF